MLDGESFSDYNIVMFTVLIKKKTLRDVEKMPLPVQKKFRALADDLREKGPVRPEWANYSKIGMDQYHCHLSHKWVACWYSRENTMIIEVYYAGSRENAPY